MSRRARVSYDLDTGAIKRLPDVEIKAILRAADEIISVGGRNMLCFILKGSNNQQIKKHGLESCPVHGFYRHLKLEEIKQRVDWMIVNRYLRIEYDGRLPMLVFTERGWEIEREQFAEELLVQLSELLKGTDYSYVSQLKDRNREMILLLIEKIKQTKNPDFVPLLKAWQEIEYKKVRSELQKAIDALLLQNHEH